MKVKKFAGFIFLIFFLLAGNTLFAQNAEMADVMRSEGKIYVVVAMILIVLASLIAYLFLLDRKLRRMEKMIDEKEKTKR